MAFMKNINDFILTLVALSLPSIAATIDCNGKPFHCMNSTHFMICVDFGSGVSSTMDDFIIPCPPTTVCQATNRFECEFPTVTTTTVTPVVTNSPLAATVSNDVVIDTVSDVTTIPFEEYFNTISTTTLFEGNLITRDAVTTELPVNNSFESFNVPATDSIINETAINVGVSSNAFTTQARLDIVTDRTTVTELIPNVAENVNVIFEPISNISEVLPTATEIVPIDVNLINLSENNTVDVTENYESNSTLLETIIGATNFRQYNTPFNNSTSYNVTEPILTEATESILRIPIDDKKVYFATIVASPDVVLDNGTMENVTESITTKPTEYNDLTQQQSNSTLNETISTGDIVQNDPTTLNTALDINGFALNVNHSGLSFNEITTKYEEQISTAEPILLEAKENTINIPVDEQIYLPTLDATPDVFLENRTIDNAKESIPAETTEYKRLIESQSNRFNNKPLDSSTSYDITEPILSDVTESIISIPVDDKQPYLSTFDASPYVVLGDQTIDNVTETVLTVTTDYKHLTESQSNSTLNKTMSGGDNVQNDTTKLNTVLKTNATNMNNSVSYLSEMTTKYKEQISTAEPILYQAKENTINILVDDKQAYLTTLDSSPDVFLDDQTIATTTQSIPTETTEYKHLVDSESNSTLFTISGGDIIQNDTTKLNTVLNTFESALNVNNSDSYFSEITTKYEEQISTAEPILNVAKENELEDEQAFLTTLDESPDVFLDNKTINTVKESIPTETTEYRYSIESQSNSTLNVTMSSGDIEQTYTTTDNTILNTDGSALNVQNSYLSLNEGTTLYYEEQISTAQNNFELSGNTGTEITQLDVTKMENITKPKLIVSTIATTTVNTEPVSTNTPNTAINTGPAGEVTVKLNVIESGNKTNIFDDIPTTELSFKVSNQYLYSTEDFVTSVLDNRSVKPENNINTTQSQNLTNVNYVENVTKTETETEDINLVLPKPPTSNETTTIVHGNHSSADNTSTTHTIRNIDTLIAQNKTTLNDISGRTDEAQRVLTSENNVINNTADHLLNPVTEPTSTLLSNNAHNVLGSDLTNQNLQDISTFVNIKEVTARGNVTNETLMQNVIVSDMINSTKITVTPSNHIELSNRVSVSTADDQINTVEISESTPNDILETATHEVNSLTFSNLYYQTDIEEISHDQGVPRHNILSADTIESTSSILVLTTESTKEQHFDAVLQATTSFNSVSDQMYSTESDNYLTSTTNSPQPEATASTAFDSINSAVDTTKLVTRENEVEGISTASSKLEITSAINENLYVATEQNTPTTDIINLPQQTAITSRTAFVNTNSAVNQVEQVTRQVADEKISTEPSMLPISFTINKTAYVVTEQNIPSAEVTPEPADLIPGQFKEISHDQGVPRHNILSADTIESTSSILVLTTESTKEQHFDAVLQATTSFNSVSDQMYSTESDNYLTSTTNSPQPEATASTAFDSINSAVDTTKLVTRENEVEGISIASSKLEITSAINENLYVATEQNTPTTDIINLPQQTAITSRTAFVNTNSAVNQVEQVTRQVADEKISTEPSMLPISFTINKTAYVGTEQNIPSAEVTPEPADLIPGRFKYTTTTETANESLHQESRITITSDSATTKPSASSALKAQNNGEINETLPAITTSNTATDSSAILNLTVSSLSGVSNFDEEINGITFVDSLTTETTVDEISKASTDNVLEKYPITIKEEDINPENSIKTNTTTEHITVSEDIKHTEPLHSYSIQTENISELEITSVVTDQTTLVSFIADDVKYTENQNKLADTQDRVLSNAQVEPNIPKILPERFGANAYDLRSSIIKATFIDGLTSINTTAAADTMLTRNETNQQSTQKIVTPKISTTDTLLKEKVVLPVLPEQKTNSGSIVKTLKSYGDINTNPIITTGTSSFESHTERKLSFTTSIQESKYRSNLVSSTESWRTTVVTEPNVHPTRPFTETLITSSKPYTEPNDQMSQDVTSRTLKLNVPNPSENQYINFPQNIEPTAKNVLTSMEPSVIFPQITEPSGVANQDVESSSVRKSTTQKSYGMDKLQLVQNQGVSSTENHFIDVTPLASPSTITKPIDLSTSQSFTAPNTQTLPEHHVLKNGEKIKVPTTEKLKVNVIPIISSNVKVDKPLVDVTAVPILNSSNNISKEVMPDDKTHIITDVYNSKSAVESVPKIEFKKVQFNITSTTEKTMTQSSDLDIVIVDIVNTDFPNLGAIATVSNNTHSGISAIKKPKSQQVEKHKAFKSVAEDEHQTEKEEKPETEKAEKPENEKEEKPEAAETNRSNGKIEHLTSTESIPINNQANAQHNSPLNIKQKPVQNATTRTRPVDSHIQNTTARYYTKTKSSVANTHNSTHPASDTSKHYFVCKSNNRGRFSDNGDCRKFYICIGKHEPIKGICPNNTVFSELRKQCTKNLSHCVRNNQFQCVSEGRFSDYLNDNIYYICVNNKANRFIRFKLQCQNGYHVNKTSVRCVKNTESILSTSQQSQQSASEVSTSNQSISAKSEKIKEKPKTNKKFECKKSGKFPEPNDCRKYYVCTKLGKSEYRQKSKKCDSDEVYNRDKKKCVDADSYECS